MKPKPGSICPAGLLLLLLLRQAHTRLPGTRSTVPPRPSLDSPAICVGRKPPIGRSRPRRLPIGTWQTHFWTKKIVERRPGYRFKGHS